MLPKEIPCSDISSSLKDTFITSGETAAPELIFWLNLLVIVSLCRFKRDFISKIGDYVIAKISRHIIKSFHPLRKKAAIDLQNG